MLKMMFLKFDDLHKLNILVVHLKLISNCPPSFCYI